MKNEKNWKEDSVRLGGIKLKEIFDQLAEWIEDKVQEVPFKGGSETFHREWDFQIAGQLGHFEITAKISQIKRKGGVK